MGRGSRDECDVVCLEDSRPPNQLWQISTRLYLRGYITDDHLAQILVDIQQESEQAESDQAENSEEESEDQSRDIHLMASDNEEDEEEIEPENEEDRAFLDDEIQEQEDVSFYRGFHVELDRGIRQERRQQRQELAM